MSKFDVVALQTLGFESFTEAFNVIGLGLGGRPAAVKNYRDEFDPLFPNSRSGWHKRQTRSYCLKVLKEYECLDLLTFGALIKSFFGYAPEEEINVLDDGDNNDTAFARRLATGLAAEHYFAAIHPKLPEFKNFSIENTTRLGCGYDFRLRNNTESDFLAVEVKGLRDKFGSLSLTAKEHHIAETLTDRFYLFIVKNFRETPFHEIYQNPLSSKLSFERKKRVIIQISWNTSI